MEPIHQLRNELIALGFGASVHGSVLWIDRALEAVGASRLIWRVVLQKDMILEQDIPSIVYDIGYQYGKFSQAHPELSDGI